MARKQFRPVVRAVDSSNSAARRLGNLGFRVASLLAARVVAMSGRRTNAHLNLVTGKEMISVAAWRAVKMSTLAKKCQCGEPAGFTIRQQALVCAHRPKSLPGGVDGEASIGRMRTLVQGSIEGFDSSTLGGKPGGWARMKTTADALNLRFATSSPE